MAQRFGGVVGRYGAESTPWWPEPVRAREGAPNVVYVVLDDVGYAQVGCFGGLIETPHLDRLAAGGLRYANFHTTALCSPTRACLLTGRNHHANAMASIVESSMGYPGYTGEIPFENGMLGEILGPAGYATYAVGKWHLTPHVEMNMGARRDRWPLGRGFDRYYGFMGGDTNQWHPDLWEDNHAIEAPRTPEEGYHLTEDLADKAIEYLTDLRNAAPDKPFFLYFSTGAGHAPHHAPPEWIERYRGKFDMGWDKARELIFEQQKAAAVIPADTKLTPRPHWITAWESLSGDEQRLYARMMEVYAGFMSHTDHHIGRVLSFIERLGELDNTIVVAISDNGASSEGGPHGSLNEALFFNRVPESLEENLARMDELGSPTTFNHYPFGWTWAGNTPFQRWKREVHEGGVADPCIIHWPKGLAGSGEIRRQYVHAIDVTPTILDVLGIEAPASIKGVTQSAMQGHSFKQTLGDGEAGSGHETQYYEMLGNRAIYHRGWKAVTYHGTTGMIYDGVTDPSKPFDEDVWELYHVAEDFSESTDLAAEYPEKLRELQDLWWVEASKNNVLPIDAGSLGRAGARRPRADGGADAVWFVPGRGPWASGVGGEHEESLAQHDGGRGDPGGRGGGRAGGGGRAVRGVVAVRAGRAAGVRVQLPGEADDDGDVGGGGAGGAAPVDGGVREDGAAAVRGRRRGAAVRGRGAGGGDGAACDDPGVGGPGGGLAGGARGGGAGDGCVRGAVRVHGDAAPGGGGPAGARAAAGPGAGGGGGDGAAVGVSG